MWVVRSIGSRAVRFGPQLSAAHYSRGGRRPPRTIVPDGSNRLKSEKIIELDKKKPPVETKSFVRPKNVPASVDPVMIEEDTLLDPEELTDENKDLYAPKQVFDAKKKKKSVFTSPFLTSASDSVPVFDENGDLIYTKKPNKDTDVSNLFVTLRSKKDHGHSGFFIVEGWRMIVDGLKSGGRLKAVFFSRKEDLEKIAPYLPAKGVNISKIPYREIEMWSDLDTSPGLIAIFKTPAITVSKVADETFPINIICDNIREPGNLGAILRMADGVGVHKVLLSKGCVNIWEPKVIRSAAGAHFRLFMKSGLEWENIRQNVPDDSKVFIADNNTYCDVESDGFTFEKRLSNVQIDSKSDDIPTKIYYDVDYRALEPLWVVIGGETKGISQECYEFSKSKNSTRVNIPLKNNVNSLNAGMALSVVIFEMKRQIMQLIRENDSIPRLQRMETT